MATLPLHTIPAQSSRNPMCVASNGEGKLCVSWRGSTNDWIYLVFNENRQVPNWQWEEISILPNTATKYAPAVTYFGQRLFIAWINENNNVCYTFTDDNCATYGQTVVLTNTQASGSPTLSGGESLLIGYTGMGGDNNLHVMTVG